MPTALVIHDHLLPYEHLLQARDPSGIDLVVIHCTELPDLQTARDYGERILYASGTGNSGHFYIDTDGSTYCYVPMARIAHHTQGYNERSLGIELCNRGRWPEWLDSRRQSMDEPYTPAQVQALTALLLQLKQRLPSLQWIAGHEDLDTREVEASDDSRRRVRRKRDPGPQFPWPQFSELGLHRLHPGASIA